MKNRRGLFVLIGVCSVLLGHVLSNSAVNCQRMSYRTSIHFHTIDVNLMEWWRCMIREFECDIVAFVVKGIPFEKQRT